MLTPCVPIIANPWTVEQFTLATTFAAGVRYRVMVCMTVLAPTSEYPAPLSWNEKEGLAGTLGMAAPAT